MQVSMVQKEFLCLIRFKQCVQDGVATPFVVVHTLMSELGHRVVITISLQRMLGVGYFSQGKLQIENIQQRCMVPSLAV